MRALAIVLAAAAAATAYWSWPDDDEPAPPPLPTPRPPAEAPADGSPPAEGALTELTPAQMPVMPGVRAPRATFPDGTTRTALNGVTVDLQIDWPANRPYAPVVEVVTNGDGVAFYKHADGSFTTTLVRVETISGKTVQFAQTYTPGPKPAGTQLRR